MLARAVAAACVLAATASAQWIGMTFSQQDGSGTVSLFEMSANAQIVKTIGEVSVGTETVEYDAFRWVTAPAAAAAGARPCPPFRVPRVRYAFAC
jgi:hypothetical protein